MFEFKTNNNLFLKKNDYCIIIPIFNECKLHQLTKKINDITNNYILKILKKGDLNKKNGNTLLLYNVPNINADRILLVLCGQENKINEKKYENIIKKIINKLIKINEKKFIFLLHYLHVLNKNNYWKIRKTIEIILDETYSFDLLKSKKKTEIKKEIIFYLSQSDEYLTTQNAIKDALAIQESINSVKNLANMPPNICNSSYFFMKSDQLKKKYSTIKLEIIDENMMKKLGMNAYLAVGSGSKNKSLMIIMKYNEKKYEEKKPIILIGKGLTFDSGGISIKPSNHMNEMKYDMSGAAVVYGIMKFLAILKLPIYVIGVLALCENMLSSAAYRPGDIIKTMSKKTVEVLNTDAEGRLVLCDVLTYVSKYNPEIVIDIATLTGACVIALGTYYNGLISNNNQLAKEIINAGKESNDKAWQLPLDEDFNLQLQSNHADISNVGGVPGGTITAGCFLHFFAKKYCWAHLDIAGTAWKTGNNKNSTGRPMKLLAQFLMNRVKNNK
ncbi:MAG: leucyl aminopeptidase [Arsenophonus sp.]|nr:MAG: leucyl aminopeptidase [Arsenophonus sp.]